MLYPTLYPTDFLIHASGMLALALNVLALMRSCERSMRVQSGVAGVAWALNNLLMGAHTAAALSLVSAGRTAASAVTLNSDDRLRHMAFAGFAAIALIVSALTWQGESSAVLALASLLSTYAVFYLRGSALRWSMLLVSALWMVHAWSCDSWEQMAANVITAAAAMVGAWRASRATPAHPAPRHPGETRDPWVTYCGDESRLLPG